MDKKFRIFVLTWIQYKHGKWPEVSDNSHIYSIHCICSSFSDC